MRYECTKTQFKADSQLELVFSNEKKKFLHAIESIIK